MAAVGDRQRRPWPQHVARRSRPRSLGASRRRSTPARSFDPLGDLGPLDDLSPDRSRSTSRSLNVDATATGRCSSFPRARPTRRSRSARRASTLRATRGCAGLKREATSAATAAQGFRQPRPAARQAHVVDRAARRQPQCRDHPAQRFRDAHLARGGPELGAERAAQFHHQLDPRGRRAQPASSSAIR